MGHVHQLKPASGSLWLVADCLRSADTRFEGPLATEANFLCCRQAKIDSPELTVRRAVFEAYDG